MRELLLEKNSCDRKYQRYTAEVRSLKALRCLVFVRHPSIVIVLSEFVNMEKIDQRYVMQYFYLKDLNQTKIKPELNSTLGERYFVKTMPQFAQPIAIS